MTANCIEVTVLKTIDVLIGLSVVMLLMSMIITVITQFVTTVLNSRGKHLLAGISQILRQIDPRLEETLAKEIATAVLSHPLVRDASGKLGSIIHREELTKLLLELASGDSSQTIGTRAKQALQQSLVATGLAKEGTQGEIEEQIRGIVKNIGALALQLELTHPELTNNARARFAILQQANSEFVAKVNLWFDQTIDRVADRFTQYTRYITFGSGLLLALVIQLDTAALVSRLASDDTLRNSLVQQAQTMQSPANSDLKLNGSEMQNIHDLMTNNIVGVPSGWSDWTHRWSKDNAPMKILGILLSAVLLSLGAPFWYNALQNLLRMRSLLAAKDDQQRQERQLSAPAAKATAAASAASEDLSVLTDERGDLFPVA
jgi:hypothetical protein